MQRSLTYTAMPPIQVPLPFLLAAPCFALAAALLLAWQGETALASRWTPVTLAMTHLLTLGFLTMTIVGALFQLLPTVAGVGIPLARPVAALSWGALALGTLLLAGALGLGLGPAAYQAAAGVLGLAGFVVLAAVGTAISHKIAPAARPRVRGGGLAAASGRGVATGRGRGPAPAGLWLGTTGGGILHLDPGGAGGAGPRGGGPPPSAGALPCPCPCAAWGRSTPRC